MDAYYVASEKTPISSGNNRNLFISKKNFLMNSGN